MARNKKANNSGILSNSYIPPLRAQHIDRELQKLPPDTLCSLTYLWLSIDATQPIPDKYQREKGYTKTSLSQKYLKRLDEIKQYKSKAQIKRTLINLILVEFYPTGLKALQLAQIDVQLLVDKPNSNSWVSSTAKIINTASDEIIDITNKDELNKLSNYTFSLDSQMFLNNFISNLANLFLTHVYISRHPYYPLILIRVQMYEHSHKNSSALTSRLISDITNKPLIAKSKLEFENDFKSILNNKYESSSTRNKRRKKEISLQRQINIQNQPQLLPHKPFYILLPVSSPHIIHSPLNPDNVSTKLIMQTLENTLSNSYYYKQNKTNDHSDKISNQRNKILTVNHKHQKIKIFPDNDIVVPVKNLNSLFVLKGISRFGSSMGAWAPYAEGVVDTEIFGNELNHIALNPENLIDLTDEITEGTDNNYEMKKRKIVAALKFKGVVKKYSSKNKFYETDELNNNKINVISLDSDVENDDEISEANFENERLKDPFASIIPIHRCVFNVVSNVSNGKNKKKAKPTEIGFEMELLGTDIYGGLHELAVKGSVDPYKIPDWLTGETGSFNCSIKNGLLNNK